MSNLFLHNNSLNVKFDLFIEGLSKLNAISRKDNHSFYKHESIYNTSNFLELCQNSGFTGKALLDFIVQIKNFDVDLDNDADADITFGINQNAFLGIDFSLTSIISKKQIIDNFSYENWCYQSLSNFEKLKIELVDCSFSNSFENEFNRLKKDVQISIVEEFNKARIRGKFTPYYPDTKIIKDVSPTDAKCSVMELRVYTPVALRVYFCEKGGVVYLASIEQKSNPNQNLDINSAHKILKTMLGIR